MKFSCVLESKTFIYHGAKETTEQNKTNGTSPAGKKKNRRQKKTYVLTRGPSRCCLCYPRASPKTATRPRPKLQDADNPLAAFWPASVHVIGKDITWFHCVIWPCILKSAGLALPKTIFAHGFVAAADGRKMSKSLGNVIDPHEICEQ